MSAKTGCTSIALFATVVRAPVGIVSASFSLAFLIFTGIVKKLLKTTRTKKNKYNRIVMLARSKLNSIESKLSKALIYNEIKHEHFVTIIEEEKKYRELREGIRIMNSQRRDLRKITLMKKVKKLVLIKLLGVIKLLIIVWNHTYGIYIYTGLKDTSCKVTYKNEILLLKL